jgi:alpha-glucosidase
LLLYRREYETDRIRVALNLGSDPASVSFPETVQGRVLVSCFADREEETIDGEIELRPHEGLIVKLDN